jgi:hypothetical protein
MSSPGLSIRSPPLLRSCTATAPVGKKQKVNGQTESVEAELDVGNGQDIALFTLSHLVRLSKKVIRVIVDCGDGIGAASIYSRVWTITTISSQI